jgi:hypothetical protein
MPKFIGIIQRRVVSWERAEIVLDHEESNVTARDKLHEIAKDPAASGVVFEVWRQPEYDSAELSVIPVMGEGTPDGVAGTVISGDANPTLPPPEAAVPTAPATPAI